MNSNYIKIDVESYYRKDAFIRFSECKCSVSMTGRIDVTGLKEVSDRTGTKFYLNFLYVLSKVLNSRDDYKMFYKWQTNELFCFDKINPIQYVFHEDTETCTIVYTSYDEDYEAFYEGAAKDVEKAKQTREYGLDSENHPNWFDASVVFLRFPERRASGRISVFRAGSQLGKIQGGKRKTYYARKRKAQSRDSRRIRSEQDFRAFAKGSGCFYGKGRE